MTESLTIEEDFRDGCLDATDIGSEVAENQPGVASAVVAQSLYEGILRAITGTSIVATDLEGTIIFVNRGAEEMLGYAAHELIGETPALFHDLEELRLRAGELVPDTRQGRIDARGAVIGGAPAVQRTDWTYRRRGGEKLTVSLGITAITDPAGAVLGYVGIADDVTDDRWAQHLMEEALLRDAESARRLNAVDRAKSDFIATVGHELRTPLASMVGYTELLREGDGGPLNDDQALLLSRVERNAERLGNLVEELLTVARVGCESFTVADQEVNLNLVVGRGLAAAFRLNRPDLDIDVYLDPLSPMVHGAADELERVVVNLLTNAATYTPDGGRIVVSTHYSENDSFVVVADTGVGIPAVDQDQLFVPFFRSSISHERAIQGPGVGLSIVQGIVDAHGGEVSVSSDEGAGAVFIVRLPSLPRPAPTVEGPQLDVAPSTHV